MEGNPLLQSIEFPSLELIGGSLTVSNGPPTVQLQTVREIGGSISVNITVANASVHLDQLGFVDKTLRSQQPNIMSLAKQGTFFICPSKIFWGNAAPAITGRVQCVG